MSDVIRLRDAAQHGLSRGRLRGRDWQRVSHGLYRPAGASPDVSRRCRDLLPALPPAAAFCHLTAARLYGFWLPQIPEWLSVLATLPPEVDRPEREGMYVFRSRAGLPPANVLEGLPVVAPEIRLAQLAEDLSVVDLVVAIDGALNRHLCTIGDIELGIRRRQRGLPTLRRALTLCDARSESPWESILRLLHVSAGIAVEPQYRVKAASGQVVARADLRIEGTSRLAEYDGAVHRERDQHEADLRRDKTLARLGLHRYGYIAREILDGYEQIIRDAEDALGWRHDPRRVGDWIELMSPSTLTRDGVRRFYRRLHRFHRPLRGRLPTS